MDGVIVLDKPSGISSHDAVQRMRRLLGIRRIGHLGTLDPLGTGVLPLVVGRATRLSQFFLNHDREYEASIRCGFSTTTYDRDGEPTSEAAEVELSRETIESLLAEFVGEIDQVPPPVSAKKVDGTRAYKLARRDQPVELPPVRIHIYSLDLLELQDDTFRVSMRCSKGTYVRSLAHDLGRRLGAGAHVSELRRTAMGEFDVASAWTFEQLDELKQRGRLEEALVPAERLLPEIPVRYVDAVGASRISHGREFSVQAFSTQPPPRRIKAVSSDGRLLAIAEIKLPSVYQPVIVF